MDNNHFPWKVALISGLLGIQFGLLIGVFLGIYMVIQFNLLHRCPLLP